MECLMELVPRRAMNGGKKAVEEKEGLCDHLEMGQTLN